MEPFIAAVRALFNGGTFGWNNVLDIAIVFVFVYYLLRLIRGTRAVQLLLGVLVLIVIYGLAVLLQLTLTKLLFQAFLAIAVFAILIVFQPELRRGLGQLGQLGPRWDRHRSKAADGALVTACAMRAALRGVSAGRSSRGHQRAWVDSSSPTRGSPATQSQRKTRSRYCARSPLA